LSGGSQTANFSNVQVTGDVAIASGGTLQLAAPSTIHGDLYLDSGASKSGVGTVTGTTFTNQNLSSERTDAINASAQAAALTPNFTFTNITTNTTVTGVSGVNVVNISGNITLGSSNSLTLTGPADAFFVVNVGGSITMTGSGGIVVGGSVPTSHLLINMTGSGTNLISTGVGNTIQGTLLGPNAGGNLDGSFGSLILGENFAILSNSSSSFQGCGCAG
jgi:choice-of-anchor A domain-containing protein